MLIFTLRRIFSAIPTLLVLVTLVFFLLRLAPGGPFDSEQVWPAEIQANILHRYELDLPVTTQFIHWLRDVLHGDLRESFQYTGHGVGEIIGQALPVSALLGFVSLWFALLFGIPMGCWIAWREHSRPNSFWNGFLNLKMTSALSLPSYLVATVLILIFSLYLRWLPPALWEGPLSMILPVITLALRPLAMIARLVRTSMKEVLKADYIRTAHGKGLSLSQVVFKHALKNSLIPVISLLGPLAANLITGSFLVETIFQIPGMGKHFIQAVLNRDYPLVLGVCLIYGIILLGFNLLMDLLYGWIDPRIRIDTPGVRS